MKGNILILGGKSHELDEFRVLVDLGWKLFSTRRIINYFEEGGTKCFPLGTIDSCPQTMSGHPVPNPRIIAGIMADRDNPKDMNDISDLGIQPFDLVVVDPNSSFMRQLDSKTSFALEDIEVNSSIYILSAIHNSRWATPITSFKDRDCAINEIVKSGELSLLTKSVLARNALDWLASSTAVLSGLVRRQLGRKQPIFREGLPIA